ncbi:hypothetical protein MMC13_006265 [Lambiella insularis]|nr:hypothetical protein [Lambiella insularis]
MSKLKVLVVGASIAGPSAVYWFAKAGASVTIIERFPKLRIGGQSIDIRTAGVTVMRQVPGMEAAVRAKTMQLEGMSWVRKDGRSYRTIRATGNPDQQSLVSEYEIFRDDLSRILFDLTKDNDNIKYVFGEQVTSMLQNEKENGPIEVEFANGLPTSEYDLVVACDGATSRTRAMGLGCGVREHVNPTNSWAAYFSLDRDLLKGGKVGQAISAIGLNRVTLMAMRLRKDRDATLPFREAMKQGDAALKQFVAQHYKGVGWKTDEALEGMMQARDFYASEVVQVKTPSLYQGRVVLVGDAGYAPGFTGTGTSLALAGAYVLAGEVGRHKDDLAAGLAGY